MDAERVKRMLYERDLLLENSMMALMDRKRVRRMIHELDLLLEN